jgi:sugar phosphate isomerase/epimerase
MAKTDPGGFPIGFRRGWGHWQRDLSLLIGFAKERDFEFLDFGPAPPEDLKRVLDAGLGIGSVDLKDWKSLVSPDPAHRSAALEANVRYVHEVTALGIKKFLVVVSPQDPSRKRSENFDLAVNSFGQLARAIHPSGALIMIEGAPGPPPWHGSIACTPADVRAFLAAILERFGPEAAEVVCLNFDPSHLVRMGIDPHRFLVEFLPRIHHVHGKDTELSADGLYAHGNLQSATFATPHLFGGQHWRYAIPGRGAVEWTTLLSTLHAADYGGGVSIELEDEQFNGTEAGEKQGLIEARDFLAAVEAKGRFNRMIKAP